MLEPERAKRTGGCQPAATETDSDTAASTQRAAQQCAVVMEQKSAEAIVAAQAAKGRTLTDKEEP